MQSLLLHHQKRVLFGFLGSVGSRDEKLKLVASGEQPVRMTVLYRLLLSIGSLLVVSMVESDKIFSLYACSKGRPYPSTRVLSPAIQIAALGICSHLTKITQITRLGPSTVRFVSLHSNHHHAESNKKHPFPDHPKVQYRLQSCHYLSICLRTNWHALCSCESKGS